ncbi:MAG: hypothetical protein KC418_12975 [Anaerolineales bacterium]|nr:hypothetical protein [Anaerolineales bacterium]
MQFVRREEGQGLVEYALILVLLAVVVILILTALGSSVNLVYARVMAGLNGQTITGVGVERVVLGFDLELTGGGPPICDIVISNATLVVLENGELMVNSPVSVPVLVNGAGVGVLSGVTNAHGIATTTNTISHTAACPGTVTVGARSQGF